MMRPFAILSVTLLTSVLLHAGEDSTSPFAAVFLRNDAVVATLPMKGRWLIKIGSAEPRLTSPGESFELHDGGSLSLILRHISYDIACHITPPPAGLQIETTEDTRSMGGTVTKKSRFIKAQ